MAEAILDSVRSKYGAVAESTLSSNDDGVKAVAEAFGYSAEELTSIPAEANMGLSCGNPTATAHLRPGEVVVDLGSGGGLDVFLAAKMVGPTGRAIGIDMTPAMIERARANAISGGYINVEFYQSNIDSIPLPDASVDCVISNCVLNLATDKPPPPPPPRSSVRSRASSSPAAVSPSATSRSRASYRRPSHRAWPPTSVVSPGNPVRRLPCRSAGRRLRARRDRRQRRRPQRLCQGGEPIWLLLPCDGGRLQLPPAPQTTLHEELTELLSKYDVNAAAASVKVYAIKPGGSSKSAAAPCCAPGCC